MHLLLTSNDSVAEVFAALLLVFWRWWWLWWRQHGKGKENERKSIYI